MKKGTPYDRVEFERRERHLRDIAGMLRISGTEIDTADVAEWSERLGLNDIWKSVLQQVRGE